MPLVLPPRLSVSVIQSDWRAKCVSRDRHVDNAIKDKMATTELIESHRKVTIGSERNFGIVFACFFTIAALLPLYRGGALRWWAIILAVIFLVFALAAPWVLRPLNYLWFKLGLLLHHIVNPIVMAAIYYGALVPMGLLMRAFGKDLLRRKVDKEAVSYWIVRDPPAPRSGGMTKQF
jgi:hypothetical protein